MSNIDRRYFWCDAPSPLHDVKATSAAEQTEAEKGILELAKAFGADSYVSSRSGWVSGFTFSGEPPKGDYRWKMVGKTREGEAYYVPKRTTTAGKKLQDRMNRRWFAPASDCVLSASGMNRDLVIGMYFCHSACGWKDERIFISVPVSNEPGGDKFPTIPAYMTECKEWEYKQWWDLGREGVKAKAA